MVEVEEGGLGPLHQHVAAGLEGLVDDAHGVGDHRRDPGGELVEVAVRDVVGRQRQPVVDLGQDGVLLLQATSSFWRKILGSSRSWTRRPTRVALSA